jgi:hypothetical protein
MSDKTLALAILLAAILFAGITIYSAGKERWPGYVAMFMYGLMAAVGVYGLFK